MQASLLSLSTAQTKPTQFLLSDLRRYQWRLAAFILDTPRVAAWVDMRMGKTAATLTAFYFLKLLGFTNRLFVVAPDAVIDPEYVWPRECRKWEHLADLKVLTIHNDWKQREREIVDVLQYDVVVTSYVNLLWLIARLAKVWPFDMWAIDEASAYKSDSTKRFSATQGIIDMHPDMRVVELTGTPTSSGGLLNIWPQLYLLDRGEALGRTFASYQRRFFFNPDYKGYKWEPFEESEAHIYDKISHMVFRLDADDHLDFPETLPAETPIELPPDLRELYDELEREYLLEFENNPDIEAVNNGVLAGKLLQFCNGAVYDDEQNAHVFHTLKLDALEAILEGTGDNLLVAYNYRFELQTILEKFPFAEHGHKTNKNVFRRWCDRKVRMLVVHPATVAYGLDLWPGGHTFVWYGQHPSLELTKQFEARLKHPDQETIIGHRIVVQNSRDSDLQVAMAGHHETQLRLFDAMKKAMEARHGQH